MEYVLVDCFHGMVHNGQIEKICSKEDQRDTINCMDNRSHGCGCLAKSSIEVPRMHMVLTGLGSL